MTWSGPDELRGNEEIYFVTFSDGSSHMTLKASSKFLPLTVINPGLNYSIEVCRCTGRCSNLYGDTCFALLCWVCIGDLNSGSCLSSSVGRASCLEGVRNGFKSHLSAASCLRSCVMLHCFVSLSECLSIHVCTVHVMNVCMAL